MNNKYRQDGDSGPSEATSPVDLSVVVTEEGDYASYNAQSGLSIDDERADGTTELWCPFLENVKVQPGQKLKVTVAGSSWGTGNFRIWTTPANQKTSGDYVEDNSIWLRLTVNEDGSFTGTVVLTAKGETCNNITLKPGWGGKIKNLVITDIKVDLVAE